MTCVRLLGQEDKEQTAVGDIFQVTSDQYVHLDNTNV